MEKERELQPAWLLWRFGNQHVMSVRNNRICIFFSRWLDEYFTFCIHFTLNFQSIDGATNLLTDCQITLIRFLQMSSNPSLRSPQTQAESSQTKRSFVVEFPRFPSRNGVDLSQLRPCRMNAELLRLSWSLGRFYVRDSAATPA